MVPFIVKLLVFLPLVLVSKAIFAVAPAPISWNGNAVGEIVDNFHGGIRRAAVYTATGHIAAVLDTQALGWWRNGQITLGVLGVGQNHDQTLDTGALETPSNDSAQPTIRISDLAYQQQMNDALTLRIGIMDFNDHFDVTEVAATVLNAAFDNTIALSANVPVPTYPYPGFAFEAEYAAQNYGLQFAIFQGDPQHQDTVFNKGFLMVVEGKYIYTQNLKNATTYTFKLGVWDYQQPDPDVGTNNHGVYAIAQATWQSKRNIEFGAAIQGGANPRLENSVPYSAAACLSMTKFWHARPDDIMNFVLGRAWSQDADPETFFEIGYVIHLTDKINLTPDVQYFIKPSGIYPNAWVALLRLTYTI